MPGLYSWKMLCKSKLWKFSMKFLFKTIYFLVIGGIENSVWLCQYCKHRHVLCMCTLYTVHIPSYKVCVCVCVCARARASVYIWVHTYIYIGYVIKMYETHIHSFWHNLFWFECGSLDTQTLRSRSDTFYVKVRIQWTLGGFHPSFVQRSRITCLWC
jgi:hypothetical protein